MKTDNNDSSTPTGGSNIDRRGFVKKVGLLAGTVALLAYAGPELLAANAGDRPEITGGDGDNSNFFEESGQFISGGKSVNYFVVKPAKGTKFPAVFLVHEVFGVTENARNLARDLASKGNLVFIPDCLPTANAGNTDAKVVAPGEMEKLTAGLAYLTQRSDVDATRISGVGRCWEKARESSRSTYAVAAGGNRLRFDVQYYNCRFPFDRMGSLS
jgi:hypothetical protein